MFTPKYREILNARSREGIYFSFSMARIVLAVYTDGLGKVFLGQVMHRPEYFDLILHRSQNPRIFSHNRS